MKFNADEYDSVVGDKSDYKKTHHAEIERKVPGQ